MDFGRASRSNKNEDHSMKSCERGGQGEEPFTTEIDGRSSAAK